MIASSLGWPVSTTHSIVGAIVGFGAVGVGIDAVAWGKVGCTDHRNQHAKSSCQHVTSAYFKM
jgi:uncharacterized cupin superfamily protein